MKIKCPKCGQELDGSPVPDSLTLGGQNYRIKCPEHGALLVNHVANNPEAALVSRKSRKYLVCPHSLCGLEVFARVATKSKEIGATYAQDDVVYTGECPDHGLLKHHAG
jgi:hypothetical protein